MTMTTAARRRPRQALAMTLLACLLTTLAVALGAQPASATFATLSTDWERSMGWCNHNGAQLHLGDFNGDGRDDMLCHDTRTGYKWVAFAWAGRFTGTSWEGPMGWCNHNGARLYTGDVNRDGRHDMLCHDAGNGHKWVSFSDL